ncbi:hypothetical protein GCM10022420_040340 [Streptomyces iranensis]
MAELAVRLDQARADALGRAGDDGDLLTGSAHGDCLQWGGVSGPALITGPSMNIDDRSTNIQEQRARPTAPARL